MKRFTMKIGTCESEDKVENIYIIDPNLITEEFFKQKEKIRNPNATDEFISKIAENIIKARVAQELGEYEDIDEELGLPWPIVYKALKDGIWTRGGFYSDILEKEPVFVGRPEIGICSSYDECDENYETTFSDKDVMCIYTYDYEIMVRQTRLKDYGKTWALTREELENDSR